MISAWSGENVLNPLPYYSIIPSCNHAVKSFEKYHRQCFSGGNGMYEIESCGPATDYICIKQTDVISKDTGKRCFARVNLPVGAAIGACSEANGVESCYCDSDGWVDTIDY